MKVKPTMTSKHTVMSENAAHSQPEALVLMCSCAVGELDPRASLRAKIWGMNMVDETRGERSVGLC